jgi:hypothetical protein
MTNAELMTKHEAQEGVRASFLSFEFCHSLVIGHSSLRVIAMSLRLTEKSHFRFHESALLLRR